MAATKKTPSKKSVPAKLGSALAKLPAGKEQANITLLRGSLNSVTNGLEQMATLLSKPEVPATVLAAAYSLIDGLWSKVIKDQREVVRLALMSLHEQTETPELSYSYDGKTYVSTISERRGKDPEWIAFLAACTERGIPHEQVTSQVVSTVYDEEKARKFFKPEELDAMRPKLSKSLSLKVR